MSSFDPEREAYLKRNLKPIKEKIPSEKELVKNYFDQMNSKTNKLINEDISKSPEKSTKIEKFEEEKKIA
jgi:hypothetical protein